MTTVDGMVTIVTGAAKVIGKATSHRLVRAS